MSSPGAIWSDNENLYFPESRTHTIRKVVISTGVTTLLAGAPAIADHISDAYIDREARKGKGPSDHAPIVIDIDNVG